MPPLPLCVDFMVSCDFMSDDLALSDDFIVLESELVALSFLSLLGDVACANAGPATSVPAASSAKAVVQVFIERLLQGLARVGRTNALHMTNAAAQSLCRWLSQLDGGRRAPCGGPPRRPGPLPDAPAAAGSPAGRHATSDRWPRRDGRPAVLRCRRAPADDLARCRWRSTTARQ